MPTWPPVLVEAPIVQNARKPRNDVVNDEMCERVARRQAEDRDRFWKLVQEIGERNADQDPDETYRFVTEIVEEVRQERYEREQCAKIGSVLN